MFHSIPEKTWSLRPPPKPDSAQPKPPALGADASVREVSQSTRANELRLDLKHRIWARFEAAKNPWSLFTFDSVERKKAQFPKRYQRGKKQPSKAQEKRPVAPRPQRLMQPRQPSQVWAVYFI